MLRFGLVLLFTIFYGRYARASDHSQECTIVKINPLKVKCETAEGYLDGDYKTEALFVEVQVKGAKKKVIDLENLSIDEIKNEKLLKEKIAQKIGASEFSYKLEELYLSKVTPLFDKDKTIVAGCEFKSAPMLTKFKNGTEKCEKTFCLGSATCGGEKGEYGFFLGCEASLTKDGYKCPNAVNCFEDKSFTEVEQIKESIAPQNSSSNSINGVSR